MEELAASKGEVISKVSKTKSIIAQRGLVRAGNSRKVKAHSLREILSANDAERGGGPHCADSVRNDVCVGRVLTAAAAEIGGINLFYEQPHRIMLLVMRSRVLF